MMPEVITSLVRQPLVLHLGPRGPGRASGQPFHIHPIAVAELVMAHGILTPEVVAAAYLHDVLEDTLISRARILARRFTERVANLVEELTIDDATINAFGNSSEGACRESAGRLRERRAIDQARRPAAQSRRADAPALG